MNTQSTDQTLIVRHLGRQLYTTTWQAMQHFTQSRQANTVDELWFVEHEPVFTLGRRGDEKHLREDSDTEVIRTDRGGQITYHGPGQLVTYVMLDLRRRGMGVRDLVNNLEAAIVRLLANDGIIATTRTDAPGVYVDNRKIASLGLRVRRGASYHGLALNVAMDLSPFSHINPCGFPGMKVTQLKDLGLSYDLDSASRQVLRHFSAALGYTDIQYLEPELNITTVCAAQHG